uniref:Trehalose 6-phosphate phosphatase n=1 Tax=Ananas comosus var. bracteatus TaxID=296719 RepID=A0A6V7P688_ANACO|nr:unnamed protein product [Ananas comosus var. bracteatus]
MPKTAGEEAPRPSGDGDGDGEGLVGGAHVSSWVGPTRVPLRRPRPDPRQGGGAAPRLRRRRRVDDAASFGFVQIPTNRECIEGKQIVMFLDYDGTLSPIVDDPDSAFMSDAMRAAVRSVARHFPTAIVSGRCLDKVYDFVKLAELYYAGSHGMDIKGPAKGRNFKKAKAKAVLFQPASEFLPMIDEVYKALLEKTNSTPGAKVENNKFCVSVHFRCVDEKHWSGLAEQVKSVLKEYPKLKLTSGRKVLEIRPTIKWDKGKALEFLLESLGFANCNDVLPVYIGDDRTDEDAFKVLRERGQGFGILVSKFPKETNASYSLEIPQRQVAVTQFSGPFIFRWLWTFCFGLWSGSASQ